MKPFLLLFVPVIALSSSNIASFAKLPLAFEENAGQTDSRVRYLAHGPGYSLYLTRDEAVLSLRRDAPVTREQMLDPNRRAAHPDATANIRLKIVGGAEDPRMQGIQSLPGKVNYFRGADRSKWRANVPTFERVRYQDVYPGIDLIYYGTQGHVEFDWVAAPGADLSAIRMGVEGATRTIDSEGSLLLAAGGETITVEKPVLYQMVDGDKRVVDGSFRILGENEIGFRAGKYDHSRTLVVDPTLLYATYLGGSAQPAAPGTKDTYLLGMAVSSIGEAYVTGYTYASNFPTTAGAPQPTEPQCAPGDCGGPLAGPDAFVSRLSADGTKLIYSTYLGGNGEDEATGIALDPQGNAYITGHTYSNDFPLVNAIQKLCSPVGVFSFSTNNYNSLTNGCEGHPAGENNVYSANTPDAFITELNPAGSIVFSTFFGGSANESPVGIGLDAQGNIYIGGSTSSVYTSGNTYPPGGNVPFPVTTGAYLSSTMAGNNANFFVGFVAKFAAVSHQLLYSTIIGPAVPQTIATSMSVSPSGRVVLGGYTYAMTFPTKNAIQPACPVYTANRANCNNSGFLSVFDSTQSGENSLLYSTFLNGTLPDQAQTQVYGVSMDSQNNVFATGNTRSNNLPATPGAYSEGCVGGGSGFCNGVFVTKLNAAGSLGWLTYFGCPVNYSINGYAVTPDAKGKVYFAGSTICPLPLVAPFQSNIVGNASGFIAALSPDGSSLLFDSYFSASGNDNPTAIGLDSGNNVFLAGYSNSTTLPVTTGAFQTSAPAPGFQNGFVAKMSPVGDPVQLGATGIVNGASFLAGPVAPGEIVALFGLNLGPAALNGALLDNSGKLTTSIANTRVLFDGVPAALVYSSAGQVGAVAPYAVDGKTSTRVQVEYLGIPSNGDTLAVADTNPAIFTADGSGRGAGAILNADGSPNSDSNPAAQGSAVVLYLTGEGQTNPPGVDGQIASSVLPSPTHAVTATVAGLPALVQYAGAAPGLTAGVMQLNLLLPAGTPSGRVSVSVTVGSNSTQSGVTLAVQ